MEYGYLITFSFNAKFWLVEDKSVQNYISAEEYDIQLL